MIKKVLKYNLAMFGMEPLKSLNHMFCSSAYDWTEDGLLLEMSSDEYNTSEKDLMKKPRKTMNLTIVQSI